MIALVEVASLLKGETGERYKFRLAKVSQREEFFPSDAIPHGLRVRIKKIVPGG